VINRKNAVTLVYSAPNLRGEQVKVAGVVRYPTYRVWRVPGTGVNATNILDKVLVATTTALTANDTTNSLKPGIWTYFVITETPAGFSSMSNPKTVTVPK